MLMIRALLPALLFALPAFAAEPLVGRASVIDGDTIEIAGTRIRFNGVDAPESRQKCRDVAGADYFCGRASAEALDAYLAESRPTSCDPLNIDRYGRTVANCFRADGSSVQKWLVRQGYALDWPRYSKGAFAADQADAKAERAGIWQGEFTFPWEWRKAH